MSVRVCSLANVVVAASGVLASVFVPATSLAQTAPSSFKVAYYNIQSGKGEPAMSGHPVEFYDVVNCTDRTQPLNAWGIGLVQRHLVESVGKDPQVIALGLGEAWVCGSPENVRAALGWKSRSSERNGVAMVARYGFAGPEEWVQLDTSLNTNPADTMWVLRVPVCMNQECSQNINVFSAHWYGTGTHKSTTYDRQGQQTAEFLKRAGGTVPHVLVGDLNVWTGVATCYQTPNDSGLSWLRDAGYIDAWPYVNGTAEGFTGMTNRSGCGNPEGSAWKRIDYAWAPGDFRPLSMKRFGVVPAGDGVPSDHYGIIAEYPWPGRTSVDTQEPVVTLTNPAPDQTVWGTMSIAVNATDDVGVTRVEIFEDGVLAHTLTAAPFQTTCDTTRKSDGPHTIVARAYDAADNIGSSTTVTTYVQNGGTSGPGDSPSTSEIVLYAKQASATVGAWRLVGDATAAGGARMSNADAGAAKITSALAAPANYFEITFNAEAGRPYRLWLRGRADRDSWGNDSVFVQFSGSVNANGSAIYRIGTTGAASVNLEDCSGCGIAGWGWQDNGYGSGVLGPLVYFASSGPQRIRVQPREDGFSIDQIVLSSQQYLTTSPGALKLDATILAPVFVAPPTIVSRKEILVPASSVATVAGAWRLIGDASAANGTAVGHPDGGGAKLTSAFAAPANYVEFTFDADAGLSYRLWLRGRADNNYWGNDSVFVQFSGAVDASGNPIYRIGTTDSTAVNLEDASGAGLSGWGWQDNGWGTGVLGPVIRFNATGRHTMRIQTREDGLRVDQIVLSAEKYLTTAPGAVKNDSTILR